MKAALQKYIDAFSARDADALISLFADDATIEDPVGSEPVKGIQAISEFYRTGVEMVTEMSLSAPIRGFHGLAAAMAFDFKMNIDGEEVETSTIDVMEFNKGLGFTLQQVQMNLDDGRSVAELKGMLRVRRLELEARVEADQERLARVEARLAIIEREGLQTVHRPADGVSMK